MPENLYGKEFMVGVRERDSCDWLGWTFTAEQRQVLAYLFWRIFRLTQVIIDGAAP